MLTISPIGQQSVINLIDQATYALGDLSSIGIVLGYEMGFVHLHSIHPMHGQVLIVILLHNLECNLVKGSTADNDIVFFDAVIENGFPRIYILFLQVEELWLFIKYPSIR